MVQSSVQPILSQPKSFEEFYLDYIKKSPHKHDIESIAVWMAWVQDQLKFEEKRKPLYKDYASPSLALLSHARANNPRHLELLYAYLKMIVDYDTSIAKRLNRGKTLFK